MGKLFLCTVFFFICLVAYFRFLFYFPKEEECTTVTLISNNIEYVPVYTVFKNRFE